MNNKTLNAAIKLAVTAHRHQFRKDGITPYISHPFRVCMVLTQIFEVRDPAILAASILHDVIEDTATDYDDIVEACGTDVADIVAALSKDTRIPYTPREASYKEQLDASPWQVKLIKLADIYDNIQDALVSRLGINVLDPAQHALEGAQHIAELTLASTQLHRLLEEHRNDWPYLNGTLREAQQ